MLWVSEEERVFSVAVADGSLSSYEREREREIEREMCD
jgi:uncharacterized tellurite resistance protein B-like protein